MTDLNYLQATLIGEARGEPIEGIVGVGFAIRNRVLASGKTYKEICLAPRQFDCWDSDSPEFPFMQKLINDLENGNDIADIFLRQCLFIGHGIYEGSLRDNTGGSKNYVTIARYNVAKARNAPQDKWILDMKKTLVLGTQIFLS